ncbi:hypothetical protein V6N13_074022 [Hibiscus sabdariffa]
MSCSFIDVTTVDERQTMLERSDMSKWFVNVEACRPELTITNRSAWLSVLGLPMHLWSEESFNNISQLWGRLIRMEEATLEPQSFEQARILIETNILARVEETVELILGDWSGQIRVQEVEVVHSHDVVCHCKSSELLALSEVDPSEGANLRVCRVSPLFIPELGVLNLLFVPELGVSTGVDSGQDRESPMVVWDECVGLLDRETGLGLERFDVMWCDTALESRGREVVFVRLLAGPEQGGEGDRGALTVLQLEWNSQQDKDFEFSNSNLNSVSDRSNARNTSLTYAESDLVPVPVKSAVKEQGVEVIVAGWVFRNVRSVNDLVRNTGSEEQKCILAKARGKGRRNKAKSIVGDSEVFGNYSLSVSDFQARQAAILKEAEATARLGELIGVETVGREDEIITD